MWIFEHKITNRECQKCLSFHAQVKASGRYVLRAFKKTHSEWFVVFAKWIQSVWPRITEDNGKEIKISTKLSSRWQMLFSVKSTTDANITSDDSRNFDKISCSLKLQRAYSNDEWIKSEGESHFKFKKLAHWLTHFLPSRRKQQLLLRPITILSLEPRVSNYNPLRGMQWYSHSRLLYLRIPAKTSTAASGSLSKLHDSRHNESQIVRKHSSQLFQMVAAAVWSLDRDLSPFVIPETRGRHQYWRKLSRTRGEAVT